MSSAHQMLGNFARITLKLQAGYHDNEGKRQSCNYLVYRLGGGLNTLATDVWWLTLMFKDEPLGPWLTGISGSTRGCKKLPQGKNRFPW